MTTHGEMLADFTLFDRIVAMRAVLFVGHNGPMAARFRLWATARNFMIMEYGCEDGSGTEFRCSMAFDDGCASISVVDPAASRFAVNHGRVEGIRGGTRGESSCDGPSACLPCAVHQAVVISMLAAEPMPTTISLGGDSASAADVAIAVASVRRWLDEIDTEMKQIFARAGIARGRN